MSEHDIDIADMQCWIFRMAQTRWKKSPEACSKIFQDNDVFGFIATGVPFSNLFFQFASSPAYKMLFDYSTGLWMEGPDYLRDTFEDTLNPTDPVSA